MAALVNPISFPDIGVGEQEHDPNSALQELDRGLKSSNVGEQCEAISRFPSLFEKYPFPILINSAMLKLAEVFRQETAGSNFVRVCVCEVLETSSRHLDKLINVDEFLRRITTVMHANDPLARALTLRALGLLCGVVSESGQVQHLVRDALNASHSLELQAAIAAAEKYAAVSKTFAVSMCERLTQMLSALSTPVEVKLQLIKVFQHMHHDAETAATVRGVCLQLLERYPTQRVVITTLHALTQLAAHCLVHIPHQVDLVLSWVSRECRACVRDAALRELRYLALAAPHAWTPGNVTALVAFTSRGGCGDARQAGVSLAGLNIGGGGEGGEGASTTEGEDAAAEQDKTTTAALDVLATLTSAPALPHLHLTPDCELVILSQEFVYDANVSIATIALQLFTNVALYMHDECNGKNLPTSGTTATTTAPTAATTPVFASAAVCTEALHAGVSLLHTLAQQTHDADGPVAADAASRAFKIPLVCCVLLARCHDGLTGTLAHTLVTLLTDDSLPGSADLCRVLVCEALASLGGSRRGVLAPHLPQLLALLHTSTKGGREDGGVSKLILVVCSVVLQAYLGHAWDSVGLDSVLGAAQHTDRWTAYRVARQAARYGHHQVACSLYNSLRSKVCTDQQHYWLTALSQVSSGESWAVSPVEGSTGCVLPPGEGGGEPVTTDVVDDRAKPLTAAAACLHSALANFKACSTGQHPLEFVQRYTSLRAAALSCHAQLVTTCQSMRTSPPPAIAATQGASLRDEMARCCRLVQQLNKLAKDFSDVAAQYGALYQSQFDADPQTLSNVCAQQQGAKLMARAIAVLTKPMADHQYQSGGGSAGGGEAEVVASGGGAAVQEQLMQRALARASRSIAELEQLCSEKKPIVECQLQLLTAIGEQLTGVPLPYPRLFYQTLQRTSITLNITPQPRTPGEPIVLQNSSQVAVKVEGVISHGRRAGLFRTVRSVTLHTASTLQNRTQHALDVKVEPNETLSQTVEPHNDFFSAQFLLAFPVPGLYMVVVDASVTDGSDETWQTGPRHSLTVKALEDPTNVKPAPPQPLPSTIPQPSCRPTSAQQGPPQPQPQQQQQPGQMQPGTSLQQMPTGMMLPQPLPPGPPCMMPQQVSPVMQYPPLQGLPLQNTTLQQQGMPLPPQPISMQMQYHPQPVSMTTMMGGYPRPPL